MSEKKSVEEYLKAFERMGKNESPEPSWLRSLREKAITSFAEKGFPTLRDEAWRYTDVSRLGARAFEVGTSSSEPSAEKLKMLKEKSGHYRILVVNGKFSREHSTLPCEITVMALEDAIRARPDLVEPYLGRGRVFSGEAFSDLNLSFFCSGVLIYAPENVTVKEPIQMIYVGGTSKDRLLSCVRNLIVMEAGSKVAFVESYVSESAEEFFTNAVTEVFLDQGAILDHVKIQGESLAAFHIASTYVFLRGASAYNSFSLATGSRLSRQDTRVVMEEEGASCELNGLCLGDGDQLLDQQTWVDHQKPDGQSHQFFKGLWAGNSRGVFRGQVFVRQDAQRTDAHQTNKNLLLSETAKVDVQPQLEILADDVKCSHGAAIGQLQEDAVFYLRSRGIGEKEAGRILAQGFAREVIERSGMDFFKETLLELVNQKLSEQLSVGKELR